MTNTPNDNTLFTRLRRLIADCGPSANKNDKVWVAISACIDEGVDTRPQIVGVIKALGFDPRHVAMLLNSATGDNPARHTWKRDTEGHYSHHPSNPLKAAGHT